MSLSLQAPPGEIKYNHIQLCLPDIKWCMGHNIQKVLFHFKCNKKVFVFEATFIKTMLFAAFIWQLCLIKMSHSYYLKLFCLKISIGQYQLNHSKKSCGGVFLLQLGDQPRMNVYIIIYSRINDNAILENAMT